MSRARVLLTVLLLLAFWTGVCLVAHVFYDRPVRGGWILPPALTLLQWMVAPAMLRALYRITWCPREQFEALYRDREAYLRVGVIETEDAWCMTFGHAGRRVDVILTVGLLQLFAEDAEGLNAILARELYLGDQPDLGAASALAAPLIWTGVTDEFFLGAGRRGTYQRGLGGGMYVGLLAHAAHVVLLRLATLALWRRHQEADEAAPEAWKPALRRLALSLQGPLVTDERALRRAYAARGAVLTPVDVGELARLAVFDPDFTAAAGLARTNPWEARIPHFHPSTGQRLDIAAVAVDERYRRSWRQYLLRHALPGALLALAVADIGWRHADLGGPCMALGLAWLLSLRLRYPGPETTVSLRADETTPWFPAPVTRWEDRCLPLSWPPVLEMGLPAAGPYLGEGTAPGWMRYEATPYLELCRAAGIMNRAPQWRAVLASAGVGVGVLLNLATVFF